MVITQNVLDYINSHHQEAFDLLIELARIPAPSHHEEKRAAFILNWLHEQGARQAYIDDALNVVCPIGCTESNPLMVFMAHSDVVFPDTNPLPLRIADGKIHCPGIGDDTANVVALLMAAKYITQKKVSPVDCGILLVVNSCEEGLGNLKGSRKIMEDFGYRVQEFITFDGNASVVVNDAVGSQRYRVEIRTEGGHSYGNFGNRNAIACLASLIDTLYAIQVPPIGKTTYNVGIISGGTSVNTIAQYAEMLYEFRSNKLEALEIMEQHFKDAISQYRDEGLDITVTLLGNRPCSGKVNAVRHAVLSERAADAIQRHYAFEAQFGIGSTDCNIPLSMGIPAVCVGCVMGHGAHTREEYVEIESLRPGLAVALELILHHF